MNSWLYPISKSSGYRFEDEQGHSSDTSYESFRDFVVTGRIKDRTWGVYRNYDRVELGDEIFIYTGDGNHGIVGYAKVIGKRAEARQVILRLDTQKTHRLRADPVPAQIVRPLIPPPRASVVDLASSMRELRKLLPWNSVYQARAKTTLSALKLRPVTFVIAKNKGGVRRKWLRHDSILEPVRMYLKAKDYEIGVRSFGRLRADLVGLRRGDVVIVEAKMIERGAGRLEAREGLGQFLEYSWLLGRERSASARKPILWLAFSAKPKPDVSEFLASQNVLVSWPSNAGLKFLKSRELA